MHRFTGINNFEITKDTCFVCGRLANTKEHLFPKWLQNKFNLWDKMLQIPNKTMIAYRQLVVPCCDKCNNTVFSDLENRISSNNESETDMWLWANKIHFALTLKDSFLEWDRKNPGYKIGDVISPLDPLEQSRHFLHCVSGDFKTQPYPFGSVFKFNFTSEQDFNFIHIIKSNSICISLGNRGYVLFIRDGLFLRNNKSINNDFIEINKKSNVNMFDMLFFYAKNLEYLERFELTIPLLVTKGCITKVGDFNITNEKPRNKPLLQEICDKMGITWIDSEEG